MTARETWIDIIHTTATGTRKVRRLLTPVGLIVFACFTGLFVSAALVVDRLFDLPRIPAQGTGTALSILLLMIGTGLTAWSAIHFLRVKGTPVPVSPPPTLVTTGPYRYARNPMLTGVFLILFGIGIAVGSLSLIFVFTPLYVLAHLWELKRIEEPELAQRLGEEYIAYQRRTPMFVPRLKGMVRNRSPQ